MVQPRRCRYWCRRTRWRILLRVKHRVVVGANRSVIEIPIFIVVTRIDHAIGYDTAVVDRPRTMHALAALVEVIFAQEGAASAVVVVGDNGLNRLVRSVLPAIVELVMVVPVTPSATVIALIADFATAVISDADVINGDVVFGYRNGAGNIQVLNRLPCSARRDGAGFRQRRAISHTDIMGRRVWVATRARTVETTTNS